MEVCEVNEVLAGFASARYINCAALEQTTNIVGFASQSLARISTVNLKVS